MPSGSCSRRRLLTAGGGCLSVALAGCAGLDGSESSSGTGVDGDRPIESTHDYESMSIRVDGDDPFVYPSEDDAETADDGPGWRFRARFLLVDEDDAAALWIDPDIDGTADARAFVEATDFDAASVFVDQRTIDDCYRRRLRGVRAAADSLGTDYCRELKAPTTPCEADKTVVEAVFVRVHRPYDEAPSSRGSSQGTSCPAREDRTGSGSAGNETDGTEDQSGTDETGDANETSDDGATNGGESR